jgi:hypothetical protein
VIAAIVGKSGGRVLSWRRGGVLARHAIPRRIGGGRGLRGRCGCCRGETGGVILRGRNNNGRVILARVSHHHGQAQDYDGNGKGMLLLGKDHDNSGPCKGVQFRPD